MVRRVTLGGHRFTASNKRVDIMGDELSSLSNDGRIATEKSAHIFLIAIDRPKKLNTAFNTRATFPGTVAGFADANSIFVGDQSEAAIQKSGLPAIGDLAAGQWGVFKDTSGGGVYLAYNDAGTIKKVALT